MCSAIGILVMPVGVLRAQTVQPSPSPAPSVGPDENTKSTYTRFLQMGPGAEPGNPATIRPTTTEAERKARQDAFIQFSTSLKERMDSQPSRGPQRMRAAAAVAAEHGRNAQMARLLKNQEERTPQPDAREYLAATSLLEEVTAAAEDPDFAQVIFWNEVALNVTANDHTPLPPGGTLTTNPFEQVGPAKTSRALAIVHIAMFEAMNAALHSFESYPTQDGKTIQAKIFERTAFPANKPAAEISIRTAVAYAAYRTLVGLYPGKVGYLTPILVENATQVENPSETGKIIAGVAIGEAAAAVILDERKLDGSEYSITEPPVQIYSSTDPMKWKKDPLNADPNIALGALWPYVRPFVGTRENLLTFRPLPPPPLDPGSAAFQEVMHKGGDPKGGQRNPPGNADRRETVTTRTEDEEFIGKFWAYDATALLCAPPRLYNMVATSLALNEKKDSFTNGLQLARYLALVNVALADAGVGAWEAKYYYRYPRPVTGIRDTAPANSPLKFWTPLGAPVSNAQASRVNFTPPFPSYPSGHAVFGGALFEVLRKFYGTDAVTFDFVSDEYNGKNRDPGEANPRLKTPRHFTSFTQAEKENGQSRIYLGIHWQYDSLQGIEQGHKIGDYVCGHVFKPGAVH